MQITSNSRSDWRSKTCGVAGLRSHGAAFVGADTLKSLVSLLNMNFMATEMAMAEATHVSEARRRHI